MNACLKSKKLWVLWMPIVHVVISIVWEMMHFPSGDDYPYEFMQVARDVGVSFEGERWMFYLLSKFCGVCLIFVLWNLIYVLVIRKSVCDILFLIIGTVGIVLLYPNNYLLETDNLLLYANSLLYYPDYWQSVYIGWWYNACLMVVRHSIALPLIQMWLYVGGVSYLSCKCRERWGKWAGIWPCLLLFLPEAWIICADPYRNCVYAVLGIWYYSLLFFEFIPNKNPGAKKVVFWTFFTAFFALMRTEGLMVLFLYAFLCLGMWKCTKKKRICALFGVLAVVLFFAFPQKIGEVKYYGKDYQIVNHIEPLQEILCNKDFSAEYEGAADDLQTIAEFVPLDRLKRNGLTGFRIYNYETVGTVNQTLRGEEEQNNFLRAATRIEKNNIGVFLNQRLKCFVKSNGGMSGEVSQTIMEVKSFFELQDLITLGDNYGINKILESKWSQKWLLNEAHSQMYFKLYHILEWYSDVFWELGGIWLLRLFVLLLLPTAGIGYFLQNKRKENLIYIIIPLVLLAQWAGIMLFSPVIKPVYYYPIYIFSIVWEYICIQMTREQKIAAREEV